MISVMHGDMLELLPTLDADSLDAVVTDPPYGISFMGSKWDDTVAFRPETWAAVYRVLKPGGHMVAMGGTRTYHRLVCAIEDAGFEIRDTVAFLYGSGFPKSHDISRAIDRAAGAVREVVGETRHPDGRPRSVLGRGNGIHNGGQRLPGDLDITAPATERARKWQGFGTALKPAMELICLARKPLSERTIVANVLRHGTGAINVDACRVEHDAGVNLAAVQRQAARTEGFNMANSFIGKEIAMYKPSGRWPANIVTDGSAAVVGAFPDAPGQQRHVGPEFGDKKSRGIYGDYGLRPEQEPRDDGGSAARFFYTAKADKDDRLKSLHPTVKPVDLIRWLARLITPPGGTILDPFAGSGTTGMAAMAEGFNAVLIEREAAYVADINRRLAHVDGSDTPLFADPAA